MRILGNITLSMLLLSGVLLSSCGENTAGEKEETAAVDQSETVSYVSEDISFGIFFDKEGTERTVRLGRGQKELDIFIIVQLPDSMEIAAVQWKLEIPAGVEIDVDRYNKRRIMSLGQMQGGISERYKPCLSGPKALIHQLTLKVTGELKNATFSIVPSPDGNFLGIADCSEGFAEQRASSYKAVVNPE